MSVSSLLFSFLLPYAFLSLLQSCGSAAPSICPRSDLSDVADDLRSQCPSWIELSPPEEVHSNTLDEVLARLEDGAYISVLFYASWCPFSQNIRPTYDALTSMFPKVRHFTVEESSAMPRYNDGLRISSYYTRYSASPSSTKYIYLYVSPGFSAFSRHGIHSFPTILLASRTASIRYHGPKDLNSLARFYKQSAGQDPVAYFHVDRSKEKVKFAKPSLETASELLKDEPYLAFSLLFVLLRAFTYLFPKFVSQLKAFWMLHGLRHLNLGLLSELSQLLGRFLHVIDIKRALTKLGLFNKTRSFHKGAKNARVWASSLASVSLGDSSRSSHSD